MQRSADAAVLSFLEKANKAASIAAHARAVLERKAAAAARAQLSGGRGAVSGGVRLVWRGVFAGRLQHALMAMECVCYAQQPANSNKSTAAVCKQQQ